MERRQNLLGYAFIMPALVLIGMFFLYPMIYTLYISFHEWDALSTQLTYIGTDNYTAMLQDKELGQTLFNTLVFTVGSVPASIGLALLLAVLLDQEIRGRGFFRTVFFTPVVTSFVAAGLVFVWMLNTDYGFINKVLGWFGIHSVNWLQSSPWAMISVILITIWKNAGYFMVIFLAGLQSIPHTYYEAASLEGAGSGWKGFRFITWPLLQPTTLFVTVICLIFTFRTFEQVFVMTKGGPLGTTKVLVYYIYEQAFKLFKMGYASALSMILLVLVLLLTLIQFKVMGGNEPEYH